MAEYKSIQIKFFRSCYLQGIFDFDKTVPYLEKYGKEHKILIMDGLLDILKNIFYTFVAQLSQDSNSSADLKEVREALQLIQAKVLFRDVTQDGKPTEGKAKLDILTEIQKGLKKLCLNMHNIPNDFKDILRGMDNE